jgi:protein-L-isoaspartate(D-aspartate) O-methyltransferase
MTKFDVQRQRMVDYHIAARGISQEAVLEAMRNVPRHEFVTSDCLDEAYADYPLPIGHGQTISQPYIVALMTELLDVRPENRVLEIGTGCGYQTAILARLAERIYSIERIPELAELARRNLDRLGVDNVTIQACDGTLGWPERAPFDRVMVTAAAPKVPDALVEQLADKGKMVIPVGPESVQDLVLVRKERGRVFTENHGGCRFVKLIGRQGWTEN